MKKIKMEDFISRYEPLYYGATEEFKKNLKDYLNINKLNVTDYSAEEKVMELLRSSTFNKFSLAWKAGKVGWNNEQLITTADFEKDNCYVNGYGGKIKKADFKKYCRNLEAKKKIINDYVYNEKWEEAYKEVMEISPKNIGPVYNINTLFFLTRGKAPIYDAFAHRAVKALLFNILPSEVYLGSNPDKKDVEKVTAMYQEYMILLKMVFPNEINKNENGGMFISRELDRALWVYGHATKKYKP